MTQSSRPVVVIDPGHGGNARVGGSSPNNATGPNGLLEKNLTLDLAQRVAPLLAAQAQVILTRTSDTNLGLAARAQMARNHNAALFMSIHLNGWHDPAVDGTTLYIARHPNQRSRDFAQTLADQLSAVTGVRNRGVHQKDFGVLLPSRHAPQTGACLAEVAFLTNPQQARRLEQEAYRQQLAEAMAEAIRQHLPMPDSAAHSLAGAWMENTAGALQNRPPSWELPANFPTQIRDFWRAQASRLHHYYWHLARMNWDILATAQKNDIQTFGFSAPPRLAGTSTRAAVAGAGLDFLHMHRQMIGATRALISTHRLAYRLRGWNPVPWNHTDSIWPMPSMSVTPLPEYKTQPITDNWRDMVRDRYWNDRWLASVTLDTLGTQIEEGIHNWFHMHWATDPPANVATSDWLGNPFSSAANPAFWKLHGWIDELMARWERANTRARTGRTVAGAFRSFTPWLGPVPRTTTPAPPSSKSLVMITPEHHGRLSPEDLQARIARIDFSRWNLFPFANLTLEQLRERFGSPNRPALVAGMDFDDDIATARATQAPTLGYGVPGGTITDPFYRDAEEKRRLSGRTGGRTRHLGLDVSTSNARGGGADDQRRGLSVFATIRPSIEISALNAVRADNNGTPQTGLGIRGQGTATLQHAMVLVQPWRGQSDGEYGGALGLACRYAYTKTDGSAGRFTLYIEYLHLITPEFLPKDGSGRIISETDWRATNKGIEFGPRMRNNAQLSAAELTGGAPLLVGYLGATQFPHVHIQVAYADGEARYVRRPRFEPTVMLQQNAAITQGLDACELFSMSAALPNPSSVVYQVETGKEYGPNWRAQRPPGLSANARLTSRANAALSFIDQIAATHNLGQVFVNTVKHLAQTESGAMFARPANNFDARPQAQRPTGRPLITAWGAFQFNRDAWRALPGVGPNDFPWDCTPYDELVRPLGKYAELFAAIIHARGAAVDAARGVRLWHRTPSGYRQYLNNGRQHGFASAWQSVAAGHRNAVDTHLRNAGILVDATTHSQAFSRHESRLAAV